MMYSPSPRQWPGNRIRRSQFPVCSAERQPAILTNSFIGPEHRFEVRGEVDRTYVEASTNLQDGPQCQLSWQPVMPFAAPAVMEAGSGVFTGA
jgi:hypothetical protein